jgi:hypothetical protein
LQTSEKIQAIQYLFAGCSICAGPESFHGFDKVGRIMCEKLTEMSWSHVDWCMFFFHFRTLNACHFGMVEAVGLNCMALKPPSVA